MSAPDHALRLPCWHSPEELGATHEPQKTPMCALTGMPKLATCFPQAWLACMAKYVC